MNHFHEKLLKLKGLVKTEAERRHKFYDEGTEDLNKRFLDYYSFLDSSPVFYFLQDGESR